MVDYRSLEIKRKSAARKINLYICNKENVLEDKVQVVGWREVLEEGRNNNDTLQAGEDLLKRELGVDQ